MKMDEVHISPNFFQILRGASISTSAYQLAMYLPEAVQNGDGPINLSSPPEDFTFSQVTFRRAVQQLAALCIIAPTGDRSPWYHCNPHLIWADTTEWLLKFNRQCWNHMVSQRLQKS